MRIEQSIQHRWKVFSGKGAGFTSLPGESQGPVENPIRPNLSDSIRDFYLLDKKEVSGLAYAAGRLIE